VQITVACDLEMMIRRLVWNRHGFEIQLDPEFLRNCIKVKESRNRPGVAQRVPGGLGYQIFMTFGAYRW
jgi:hypothetical protein